MIGRAGVYTMAGLALGLTAAWMFAGSVEAFLFDVRGRDLTVYLGSATVLALVALLAASVPALRASRVDPVIALRTD